MTKTLFIRIDNALSRVNRSFRNLLAILLIAFTHPFHLANAVAHESITTAQTSPAEAAKPLLTIGILSFRSLEMAQQQWQPLADYLNQSLPGFRFNLQTLHFPQLQQAIEEKQLDFVLTNPANYIQLMEKYGLSAPLTSVITHSSAGPMNNFAGTIVVRADNEAITRLGHLKNKTVAIPSKKSLGAYMMQAFELRKIGIDPQKNINWVETGMPHDLAVKMVAENRVDAAFVRSGVLEALQSAAPERYKNLKVINQPDFAYPYKISTRTYPEWPLTALPHTDIKAAGLVTGFLLSMEHNGQTAQKIGISGFSIPSDYEPIRQVLRSLRIYPYAEAPEFTLRDVFNQYPKEIGILSLFAIIVILLSFGLASANRHLKTHQQQLQEQADSLAVAAVAFDTQQAIMITAPDEKIISVNKAFCDITGYEADEVIGQTPRILKSNYHSRDFFKDIWLVLQQEGYWQGEIWNRRKTGELYPIGQSIKTIRNANGEITHYLATFTDITLHKENEQKIQELAFYDPLTELANRRLFKDHLTQTMATSEIDRYYFALIFIDLDNFKTLNDTLGHHYGDQLLQQVGQRLKKCLSSGDTVCRSGGDEFILLLPNISTHYQTALHKTGQVAEKILACIGTPYELPNTQYSISASLGVTLCIGQSKSAEELMKHSDLAMYQSKKAGKNTISFFDPKMQAEVEKRSALENALRSAIGSDEFRLYYQPKFTAEGQLIGFEALTRWFPPESEMISPAEFIPIAEETGLIVDLGLWVLETACQQIRAWSLHPETRHLTIAVNISERHLRQDNFVEQSMKIIQYYQIDPNRLEMEITESLMMGNVDDSVKKMRRLQAAGISFSLDDFGTGYSALAYLRMLPISTLKIDQSFVRDMLENPESLAIVHTIINLGKTLNLTLVAEGVETPEQKELLAQAGCHFFQGYLLGRPQPLEALNLPEAHPG
jgi:diguanylate cyclase (GGDEF)-like protein/PAS domain S-box-containing protein